MHMFGNNGSFRKSMGQNLIILINNPIENADNYILYCGQGTIPGTANNDGSYAPYHKQ